MKGANPESRRKEMVERQLKPRGIRDVLVLEAMGKVPRHVFIPPELLESAYEDRPLPIGEGQTISQPYMVAAMTEALKLEGGERVLEIGTGSGYQAAVLAEIVGRVITVERIAELSKAAEKALRDLGYVNIEFVVADGSKGHEPRAPYDAILVTAGAPVIPDSLLEQLADRGRLVIPVGNAFHQTLTRVTLRCGHRQAERLEGCVFVPLIGEFGWSEDERQSP